MKSARKTPCIWPLWCAVVVLAGWCLHLESEVSDAKFLARNAGGTDAHDVKRLSSLESRVDAIESSGVGARRGH